MAKSKVPANGTYQHYKGGFYEALGIAEDPESGSRWVVYVSLGITENLLEGKPGEEAEYDYRVLKNGTKGCWPSVPSIGSRKKGYRPDSCENML
jgi:hypothetical protein